MDIKHAYGKGGLTPGKGKKKGSEAVSAVLAGLPQGDPDEDNFTSRFRPAPTLEHFDSGWATPDVPALGTGLEAAVAELQRRAPSKIETNDLIIYTIFGVFQLYILDSFVSMGRRLKRR